MSSNKIFRITYLFFMTSTLLAQGVSQSPPEWTEHFRNSTISIGRIVNQGQQRQFQVLGTGIIVALNKSTGFIVTAKHIFGDPSQSWHPSQLRVRFAWQEKKSLMEEYGEAIDLTTADGTNLWTGSADADLAALPLPRSFAKLPLHAVGFQDFASEEELFDGATVFIFGYPNVTATLVGGQALARAITRGGVIAWTDPSGPTENPFLIDANILPGNSGGPVFKVPTGVSKDGNFTLGGRVAFLGIVTQDVSGWYAVQADGRIIQIKFPDLPLPSVEHVQVTGIGGLGKVEPAAKVRRLIESMRPAQPSQ
jgi:trypsin-like peptidase